MKPLYYKVVCLLFYLACLISNAFAQDAEFRWEKHYYGARYNNIDLNHIFKTLFDSAGNVYVFGEAGWGAQIDGEDIGPEGMARSSLFVAKFDTLGNKIWLKSAAQNGRGCAAISCYGMFLRDNKITIGFEALVTINNRLDSLVLFDTTIYNPDIYYCNYPFNHLTSFFITFNLDGEMTETHTLNLLANEWTLHNVPIAQVDKTHGYYPTSSLVYYDGRFIFDSQGNICYFGACNNAYWDSIDKPYIIVDNDTNRRFFIDFSQYGDRQHQYSASFFLKIDTNWNIVKQKFLVDSTENWPGIQYQSGNTTIPMPCSLEPYHLSIDEEDNIYFSGDLVFLSWNDTHTIAYPYYIYLDSLHRFKIDGFGDAQELHILMKLDNEGNVKWCNQTYNGEDFMERINFSSIGPCSFDSSRVYVNITSNQTVYFDEERQHGHHYNRTSCHFVIYDKESGSYLNHIRFDSAEVESRGSRNIIPKGEELIHSYLLLDPNHILGPEYKTQWMVKINPNTLEVTKNTPIYASTGGWGPDIHPQGYLLRTAYDDDIHGNDFDMNNIEKEMALLFFYDSTLDERRERACPATLSFDASLQQGNSVLCSWDADDASSTWELAYTSDSTNWASATMLLVNGSDTTVLLDGSGCYHFRVRRICDWGKRGAWSASVTVCTTEGIDSPDRQSLFSLSPNPASIQVQVVCDEEVQGIMVFNMAGVCVLNQTSKKLDISTLPKGIYQVRILTPQGSSTQKLVVK